MKNNRKTESLAPIIHLEVEANNEFNYSAKILYSPCDLGVIRNLGKNGARFAPTAIINLLKKQNNHLELGPNEGILAVNVFKKVFEKIDNPVGFESLQRNSSLLIQAQLESGESKKIIHLGGGHDHIYPLLKAVDSSKEYENILIINIDAHCDTRIDSKQHSGTPFRDFDNHSKKPFHLIQYGIHDYANSTSTLSPLKRGSEKRYFYKDLERTTQNTELLIDEMFQSASFDVNSKTAIILSLDCDGLSGSQMQAVSCVNTLGVSLEQTLELVNAIKRRTNNQFIFGIYEFNPVFDNLSQYGCKSVVHLIYEFLKK